MVKSSSPTSRSTVVATVLTVLSAIILVLRGVLGLNASYLEFLFQVSFLVLAGYSIHSNPSNVRLRVVGAVSLGTIALLLITIPLYGEATVAP
ncbi:hypothetical protein ACFFQF_25035 [Haladaptatus pallidirubidus]|uniref:hypothetical protein n=1 Tax=Haladaptatus pallidirubidus TaxID=1008152 RepID=UPI001D106087|nr:hypothetical protein [Haladaptatus pallidirubidus]